MVFLAYPVFRTIQWSFYSWNGVDPHKTWVGIDNFRTLLSGADPYFGRAVENTALWAVVGVPIQLVAGLTLALLLNRNLRFRIAFRTVFFIPVVLSPVVIGLAWQAVYFPGTGILNTFLGSLGFNSHWAWLDNPKTAIYASLATNLWRYTGLTMVFFLAALQMIPQSLYEAARVDGASDWTQIKRITLPLLRPMIALLALLGSIGALKEFDMMYILTGGGPAHNTDLVGLQVFNQGFQLYHVGYASAIATLLLVVTFGLAALQLGYLARTYRSVR